MEENKKVEVKKEQKKLSYEELENVANQLSAQANQMYAKLQEMNMTNMFKRLDYLFKVVEYETSFSDKFLNKCIAEIEDMMTVPEEQPEESSK